jgi:hypothetical protein
MNDASPNSNHPVPFAHIWQLRFYLQLITDHHSSTPTPRQQISNQLEYRLIKRRLETGTAGWTEWMEEEEEANFEAEVEAEKELDLEPPPPPPRPTEPPPPPPPRPKGVEGGCELHLERIKATIATEATKRDDPLALSITPSWVEVTTNDNDTPLSAVAAAPTMQSEPPVLPPAQGWRRSDIDGNGSHLRGSGGDGARVPLQATDSRRSLSMQRGEAWVRLHPAYMLAYLFPLLSWLSYPLQATGNHIPQIISTPIPTTPPAPPHPPMPCSCSPIILLLLLLFESLQPQLCHSLVPSLPFLNPARHACTYPTFEVIPP